MNGFRSRRFRVEHVSRFSYQQSARSSTMSVRMHPRQDKGQRVTNFVLETEPVSGIVRFDDCFGNVCHLLNTAGCHDELTVRSSAEIELAEQHVFEAGLPSDRWDRLDAVTEPVRHWDFLNDSRYVRRSPALDAFMRSCGIEKEAGPVSSMIAASSHLFQNFSYQRGCTDVNSPTDEILHTRRGVCQDYTHVLLAIGRHWKIPSRYVSGYLRLESADDFQTPVGESHCWVEVLNPGHGWIGIDPTNQTLADDRYVRVAVGRDYADVPPTKGIVFGAGHSAVEVQVVVRRECADLQNESEQ
ncbi:MAG: transglutaminase family protein [Acidiferrobacterales bacterium]|nr:transglutaminase family protein [Acidiferrobacterales bacterium]